MTIARNRSRRMWFRCIVIVLVLIIGHDALMAMNAHETYASDAHAHHEVVAQECAALEGTLAPPSLLPTTHPPAAFIAAQVAVPQVSDALLVTRDSAPHADASTRRAFSQVFLN